MTIDQSALGEFFSENEEILSRLTSNFSLIEKGKITAPLLDELYRDTHTMKGTAQLFGFNDLGVLAHAMESCLSPVRKLQTPPNRLLLDSLYLCVDAIDTLIQEAKKNGPGAGATDGPVQRVLPRLIEAASSQFGSSSALENDLLLSEPSKLSFTGNTAKAEPPESPSRAGASVGSGLPHGQPQNRLEKSVNTEVLDSSASVAVQLSESSPSAQDTSVDAEHGPKKGNGDAPSGGSGANSGSDFADSTIRVQVGVLDRLMNLVGEMVLVRNQVLQYTNRNEDLELLNLSQRLDLVTSDLQEQVMRTRMQPIGNVVGKFQRLIRDLSRELGKQIDLTIQGKDTELDKTLLEAIKDPLTHIVRNSCDHGIEKPSDRVKAGKPENGHLLISAFHEGGQVIIEISDDGKGLDRKRILAKASEKNLVSPEKMNSLSDREILSLIFLPGFSTAEKVSAVSGRGVGMDVVRTNIEKIGGSVDLESVEGKGTTIRLRIPLTLAIVPAMLARSGDTVYAIPQVKLVELVRVDTSVDPGDSGGGGIRVLQGKPVYELRGKILPLIELAQVLGLKSSENTALGNGQSTINIIVLNAEGELFGLIVDEVLDTADIVVKPLSKFLKAIGIYSAATILGNGNVALIIDPTGIARAFHLVANREQEGVFAESSQGKSGQSDSQDFLLFKTDGPGRYAIPLCMVNRLEEITPENIEYSGLQPIVRYRESILPLIDVNRVLELDPGSEKKLSESAQPLATIVVQRSGRMVGLVVNQILDVAAASSSIDDSIKDRFGVLGNLIVGEEVLTILDTLSIVERELNKLSDHATEKASKDVASDDSSSLKKRVLYAEDVAFFRRQVTKLLTEIGFEVETANDGRAAFELLNKPDAPKFDLILSDIEMPKMNGYELAKSIRQNQRYENVPLIALTTRFSQADIEKGKASGFDVYLEKLNPENLVNSIHAVLNDRSKSAVAQVRR